MLAVWIPTPEVILAEFLVSLIFLNWPSLPWNLNDLHGHFCSKPKIPFTWAFLFQTQNPINLIHAKCSTIGNPFHPWHTATPRAPPQELRVNMLFCCLFSSRSNPVSDCWTSISSGGESVTIPRASYMSAPRECGSLMRLGLRPSLSHPGFPFPLG